jgi:hypothetical protein
VQTIYYMMLITAASLRQRLHEKRTDRCTTCRGWRSKITDNITSAPVPTSSFPFFPSEWAPGALVVLPALYEHALVALVMIRYAGSP